MALRLFKDKPGGRPAFDEILVVFISSALFAALILHCSGGLRRLELASIDHRFDMRTWFRWNSTTLERLNPSNFKNFHDSHAKDSPEWTWQDTLRWATEDNHPPAAVKVAIFNRLPVDFPSADKAANQEWLTPLMSYPVPRRTLSQLVSFLAASGAQAICLDYTFPQYAPGDDELAKAILDAAAGRLSYGKKVPVFIRDSIEVAPNGDSITSNQSIPNSGVVSQLNKLLSDPNAGKSYAATDGIMRDEDGAVRRTMMKTRVLGTELESLSPKLLHSGDDKINIGVPDIIDIDYITYPGSSTFPIRPLSDLLDPARRERLGVHGEDEALRDAIVILGDGINDAYPTPLSGSWKRSHAEILAQSINTIARGRLIHRMSNVAEAITVIVMVLTASINFLIWRHLASQSLALLPLDKRAIRSCAAYSGFVAFSVLSIYLVANFVFSCVNLIVPLVVPSAAISIATAATILWERDRTKLGSMAEQLKTSQETLVFAQEKHEAELTYQASIAERKALEEDRRRRVDVVRRLNHDLKAPISVFNWTLAKLLKDREPNDPMIPIFERLKKSSEHLSRLLSEIVLSLGEDAELSVKDCTQNCDLIAVLKEQCELEKALADIRRSEVILTVPPGEESIWVQGTELEVARIVANIVGNALTHNSAGTRVELTLVPGDWQNDIVQITIKDNGKGIAQEDIEKIFQVGFRAGGVKQEGEGLGLSIAQSLLDKIGGVIAVTSTEGKGTRFDISFRRYQPPAAEQDQEARPEGVVSEAAR